MKIKYIFGALITLISGCLVAQSSIHYYPILDYSEETSLSVGGMAVYLFRETKDKSIPPNMVKFQTKLGMKKNWKLELEGERQLEEGKYSIKLPLKMNKQNREFYGIGDEIDLDKHISNEYRSFKLNYIMLRRWDDYDFGFTYHAGFHKYQDQLEQQWLSGEEEIFDLGGWCVGPGLTFQFNSLNNQLFPTQGIKAKFDLQTFSTALGSEYGFERYSLNTSLFLQLAELTTWATNLKIEVNDGDIPYEELASLGDELRIFQAGQYVDKYLLCSATELRTFFWERPYWRRIGFVCFAEAGIIKPALEEFQLSDVKYGFGIGIRYLLDTSELFTVRLDTAAYKNQLSTDFSAQEAF